MYLSRSHRILSQLARCRFQGQFNSARGSSDKRATMRLELNENFPDLGKTLKKFAEQPRHLFFYHYLYNKINNTFPSATFDMFSLQFDGTTYWYGHSRNTYICSYSMFSCDGAFNAADFMIGYKLFATRFNMLDGSKRHLMAAEQCFTDAIVEFYKTDVKDVKYAEYPSFQYYMNESQREKVTKMTLPPLPEGYVLGNSSVEDSELITKTWVHCGPGEVEQTREKLTCYPSSCVRFNGKAVAFEMIDPSGVVNHLYVLEEHRGKGLGKIVELDLAKKCLRTHILVNKCVETYNEPVIKATEKSPFWTKLKNSDDTDAVTMFLELLQKE